MGDTYDDYESYKPPFDAPSPWELEAERLALREQLSRARSRRQLEAEVHRLATQRDEFEAEKDGAWAEVKRLEAEVKEAREHAARAYALMAPPNSLRALARQMDDEEIAEAENRAEKAEAALTHLRSLKADTEAENAELTCALVDVEVELRRLREGIKALHRAASEMSDYSEVQELCEGLGLLLDGDA